MVTVWSIANACGGGGGGGMMTHGTHYGQHTAGRPIPIIYVSCRSWKRTRWPVEAGGWASIEGGARDSNGVDPKQGEEEE